MAKLNPGKCDEILPAVLVVLAIIYAGVVGRLDVLVLSGGLGLLCVGLKLPIYNTLVVVAAATFLAAYLPFGMDNELMPRKADEHFISTEEFEDEQFEDEQFDTEQFDSDQFESEQFVDEQFDDKKEEFVTENFESYAEEFEDEQFEDDKKEEFEDENFAEKEEFEDENFGDNNEEFEDENFGNDVEEGFNNQEKPKKKKQKNLPPDHGDRAEPLVLGKKYKIPSEDDDEDYHLDAGTTFLNAYKSLNPDQISAMTKDTQELINTQKQLMSTLSSLKPMITDGKALMEQFGGFLGGDAGGMGDLSKLAEKFTSGSK